LLNDDPLRAKAEILRHVTEIRLVPEENSGQRFYVAEGEWEFLPAIEDEGMESIAGQD